MSASPLETTTLVRTLLPSRPGNGGYRRLEAGPGEPHRVRQELGGAPSGDLRPICTLVHLTDLHVMDAQSPARAEFLDRFGDEDSPHAARAGRVGVYRAQETLTVQVVEAMALAVRNLLRGPVLGATVDFAISTGDATDNCQANELQAYLELLDGGNKVSIDSGDRARYEGVGSSAAYDRRYWHPDGTPKGESDDLPRGRRGFPTVPGLLDAARLPFAASGLGVPWYAVYGNHDALIAGTLPPAELLHAAAIGAQKLTGLAEGIDPIPLLMNNERLPDLDAWARLAGPMRDVAADPARRLNAKIDWISAHLAAGGAPRGHGLGPAELAGERTYYGFDHGPLRFLVLDTVNGAGGWQGSLDEEQFAWLEAELVEGHRHLLGTDGRRVAHDRRDRLFVLLSHHPRETLINDFAPSGGRRVLAEDVSALLARFPNVVAWVNGHTHENAVRPLGGGDHPGYWQLTTASHIDWPQQSRVLEFALDPAGTQIAIVATMLDHTGLLDPRAGDFAEASTLAGWSRELSLNAWQGRRHDLPFGRGEVSDRNVICTRALDVELA